MKRILTALALIAVFGALIAPRAAEADDYVGLKLGYMSFQGKGNLENSDPTGFVAGIEFDKSFTSLLYLSLETNFFARGTSADFRTVKYDTDTLLIPVMLNVKVRLPLPLIKPYAGLGLGGYYYRLKIDNATDSNWGLGWQGILGAEIGLVDFLKFYAEYQYHQFNTKLEYGGPAGFEADETLSSHQVTAGVMFRMPF